ncbi:hypothetical protein BLNAU_1061 [Blattamonas nauphoetae]|uniref:Uncharacterized protein n=1 Tax=Blattamonas nauphoetae TaxID=2049346 RepID=A0ABQ9YJZ9_9EUKA|nr:hypothetical protein BLNAU_1061 [Blattamonas nauphoetae]
MSRSQLSDDCVIRSRSRAGRPAGLFLTRTDHPHPVLSTLQPASVGQSDPNQDTSQSAKPASEKRSSSSTADPHIPTDDEHSLHPAPRRAQHQSLIPTRSGQD